MTEQGISCGRTSGCSEEVPVDEITGNLCDLNHFYKKEKALVNANA